MLYVLFLDAQIIRELVKLESVVNDNLLRMVLTCLCNSRKLHAASQLFDLLAKVCVSFSFCQCFEPSQHELLEFIWCIRLHMFSICVVSGTASKS